MYPLEKSCVHSSPVLLMQRVTTTSSRKLLTVCQVVLPKLCGQRTDRQMTPRLTVEKFSKLIWSCNCEFSFWKIHLLYGHYPPVSVRPTDAVVWVVMITFLGYSCKFSSMHRDYAMSV
jgi:hypothetical protein